MSWLACETYSHVLGLTQKSRSSNEKFEKNLVIKLQTVLKAIYTMQARLNPNYQKGQPHNKTTMTTGAPVGRQLPFIQLLNSVHF